MNFVVVLNTTVSKLSPSGLGPDMRELQLVRLPGHVTVTGSPVNASPPRTPAAAHSGVTPVRVGLVPPAGRVR